MFRVAKIIQSIDVVSQHGPTFLLLWHLLEDIHLLMNIGLKRCSCFTIQSGVGKDLGEKI